jgi:hypothetical protein
MDKIEIRLTRNPNFNHNIYKRRKWAGFRHTKQVYSGNKAIHRQSVLGAQ